MCINRTFIIAEVGLNHNGSLNLALEYVDRLKQLDINAIKFQLSNPNKLYSKESFKAKYQKLFDNSTNPLEMQRKPGKRLLIESSAKGSTEVFSL